MTKVFVLEIEYDYHGAKVLGVFATEELAQAVGERHFEDHSDGSLYLDRWVEGVAQVVHRDGKKAGECYGIDPYEVVC